MSDYLGIAPSNEAELAEGLIGHGIRKELFLRQRSLLGKVGDAAELEVLLRSELVDISCKAASVYSKRFPGIDLKLFVSAACSEVSEDITALMERLQYMLSDMDLDKALRNITPVEVDYYVSSDTLGLTGLIDLVYGGKNSYPVELKTCTPSDTIWEGDKLQVCAYSMLLEESLGLKTIPHGFVEYTRIRERRPVVNMEKLREKVLGVRDCVLDILGGTTPDICPHGSGRKCSSCGLTDKCYEI